MPKPAAEDKLLKKMKTDPQVLRDMLQEYMDKKIVYDGFEIEQVWQQVQLYTEASNSKLLQKLDRITRDETFLKQLEDDFDEEELVEDDQPEQNEDEIADDFEQYGPEDDEDDEEAEEEENEDAEGASSLDSKLEDIEEQEMVQEELKMPDDLEGSNYDRYDMDQDGFVEEEAEEELEEDAMAP